MKIKNQLSFLDTFSFDDFNTIVSSREGYKVLEFSRCFSMTLIIKIFTVWTWRFCNKLIDLRSILGDLLYTWNRNTFILLGISIFGISPFFASQDQYFVHFGQDLGTNNSVLRLLFLLTLFLAFFMLNMLTLIGEQVSQIFFFEVQVLFFFLHMNSTIF